MNISIFWLEITIIDEREKQEKELKKMKTQFFGISFESGIGIPWMPNCWEPFIKENKISMTEESEVWWQSKTLSVKSLHKHTMGLELHWL